MLTIIFRMADIYNYEGSKMGFITDTGPDTNGAQEFKKMEMMLRTMIDNISEVKIQKANNLLGSNLLVSEAIYYRYKRSSAKIHKWSNGKYLSISKSCRSISSGLFSEVLMFLNRTNMTYLAPSLH